MFLPFLVLSPAFLRLPLSVYVYAWLMHSARHSHVLLQPEKLLPRHVLGQALSVQMLFLTGLLVLSDAFFESLFVSSQC